MKVLSSDISWNKPPPGGGGGVTDHGALTGLADDDHTQYTKKATLTEQGDLYYASAASTPAALAHGNAGDVLTSGGHGANPAWAAGGASKLLSATHTDTLADDVLRGDLIIGNATPKWARLAVGAAHSILWSNGTDPSWMTAPELQYVADTGGTTRITTATASPHIALAGDVTISSAVAVGSPTYGLANSIISGGGSRATGIAIGVWANITGTAATGGVQFTYGVYGGATGAATGTVMNFVYGLSFAVTHGSANTCGVLDGIDVQNGSTAAGSGAITRSAGLYINAAAWSGAKPTTAYGIYIGQQGGAGTGTVYGLQIVDQTATTVRLLELGGATPYFRVAGAFTKGANLTPVYISEGNTPTLRQLRTFDPGNAGVNFTAGQLVCVLV